MGIDLGFGGSAIVPHALTMDMEHPYCPSLEGHKQFFKGDCRNLSFLCDEVMDWLFSSHLLEDFSYIDLIGIIHEWRRVLKRGGLLIINCPDQQKFLAHCAATGQGVNLAHHEQDFSLENFKSKIVCQTPWEIVFEEPSFGPYSWLLVLKKL